MNRNAALAVLAGALLVGAAGATVVHVGSTPAVAQVQEGQPDLETFALEPSATLTPGEETEVTLQVVNEGRVTSRASPDVREQLTTARNVRIDIENEGPITVKTDEQSIGTVTETEPREVTLLVEVPRDAEPGEYDLDIDLEYRHSAQINQGAITSDRKRTESESVELAVDDGPLFELRNADTDAQVDDSGPMRVELENVGDETARDVSVALESASARLGFGSSATETASVDELAPGETTTIEYDLAFGAGASVRGYPLEATVTYEDTDGIVGTDDYPRTTVTPAARQSFEVGDLESTLRVGADGTLRGTVTNTGPATAHSAVVQVSDESPTITARGSGGVSVGTLGPGESEPFELPIRVTSEAEPVSTEVDLAVRYRNEDDERRVDERPSAGVTIGPEQRFAFEDVESTLRVGEDGDLVGTVRNTGPATAHSVVVQFADDSPNVVPIENEVAVGTLAPGESESVRIPLEIGREADPVPREFDLAVQYRNGDDERRVYEEVSALATVRERRDAFLVSMEREEIEAGESVLVEVEVTNNLDERVTDIEGKMFTSDPLDSGDDEGFLEGLDPGESTTMTFELTANEGAVPKTYPVSFDFRYDDDRGTSTVSDTQRVAVDVTSPDDSGPPWPLVGGVAVLVLIAAGLVYWRRDSLPG